MELSGRSSTPIANGKGTSYFDRVTNHLFSPDISTRGTSMAINRLQRVGSSPETSCFLSILSGQVAVKVRLFLAGDAWRRG